MSLYVTCDNPQRLAKSIEDLLQKELSASWSVQEHGYTHTDGANNEWFELGWIRPPVIQASGLIFGVIVDGRHLREHHKTHEEVYAAYHARFIQVLHTYFYRQFDYSRIRSTPTVYDKEQTTKGTRRLIFR